MKTSLRIESLSSPTALQRPPIADDETGDQDRLPAVVTEENFPNILSDGLGSRVCMGTYLWRYTSRMMRGMFKKIVEFRQFKEANPESKKIHKYTVSGFMLPFKIWILETFPEATKFYVRIPIELPKMRCWRSKTTLSWENCCRIINVYVPNNQPIQVVANETELMLPFYVRYVNWTLNHEESPPLQHSSIRNSPPAVQLPPRRSMYKSNTCSTESATNASSSQQPEIETTVVKKKKSRTKALVKCLLGVVAELSSKVDRVLEEKDEPNKRFVKDEEEDEEEVEMINEEGEEAYCHDTQFDYAGLEEKVAPTPTEPSPDLSEHDTKIVTPIGRPQRKRAPAWYQRTLFTVVQSTAKLKKISKTRKTKIEESPKKTNEDIVNAESSDVPSNNLLLYNIFTTSPMSFWQEWSLISPKLITKHRLHILPLDMDFWARLLSLSDKGWLVSTHISIWRSLLMERRPTNARWTLYPEGINLEPGKSYLFRNVADGFGGCPKWKDVDTVIFVINVVHAHRFLAVLHLDTWKVEIFDSAQVASYFSTYLTNGEFKSFGDSIISELDVIEYWKHFPIGHRDNAKVEFVDVVDTPQQEYSLERGDCGVFVCMFMEMIIYGVLVEISRTSREAAFLYRNKMANVIWDTI
ncbi:unnamed protein product [Lactuca saligna]|uniref:Ubiquitin-like protease family profile domain-containing protein n=1 Tax=Lactuca saligna TaxID=75948 RepID=A0AA36E2A4_LACSI|nr:unnamed protein product [Lactuca saligna]